MSIFEQLKLLVRVICKRIMSWCESDEVYESGIYTTPEDEQEPQEYEAEHIFIDELGLVIFDKHEFQEKFNCLSAMVRDGVLFVLDRDSLQWVDVQKPKPKLSTVK